METLRFAVPTLFGLEGPCADELRRLGLPHVQADNGRVMCAGTLGDIPRLNLNLRTGERGPSPPETLTPCLRARRPCPGSALSPGRGSSR